MIPLCCTDRLAQLVEHRTAVREVAGSNVNSNIQFPKARKLKKYQWNSTELPGASFKLNSSKYSMDVFN